MRFSSGMATFSATNNSGVVLQVVESQEDDFFYCTNGLAFYWWTQISTLDLDLRGSQEAPRLDFEDLYHNIPSLETMEIRTKRRRVCHFQCDLNGVRLTMRSTCRKGDVRGFPRNPRSEEMLAKLADDLQNSDRDLRRTL